MALITASVLGSLSSSFKEVYSDSLQSMFLYPTLFAVAKEGDIVFISVDQAEAKNYVEKENLEGYLVETILGFGSGQNQTPDGLLVRKMISHSLVTGSAYYQPVLLDIDALSDKK